METSDEQWAKETLAEKMNCPDDWHSIIRTFINVFDHYLYLLDCETTKETHDIQRDCN